MTNTLAVKGKKKTSLSMICHFLCQKRKLVTNPLDIYIYFFWHDSPQWARASSFMRFLDHTQQHTTVGRAPIDEWSAWHRDLYLTTHDTHNKQISMPPVGFEPTISVGERPQTYALDHAATGTGIYIYIYIYKTAPV